MRIWKICFLAALGAVCSPVLRAQTVDFAVEDNGGFVPVPAGSTLTLQTPSVGAAVTVQVRVRNTGVNMLRMQTISAGVSRFTVTTPAVPFLLRPGEAFQVSVAYTSISSARLVGELQINFVDTVTNGIRVDRLGLLGVAPEFRYAFLFPAEGNQNPLANGGTVPFPSTAIGSSTTATMIVANVGSGPGNIDSIGVTGAAFRATGLPVLPIAVAAGAEFRFGAIYAPTAGGDATGALAIRGGGGNLNAVLSGTTLLYELVLPDRVIPIVPGQTLTLPETAVSTTLVSFVRISNRGTSPGTITALSVVGASFTLTDTPPLPVSIAPQSSLQATLTAIPRQVGANLGTLRIGAEAFPLEIVGLGSQLSYSYTLAGVETAVSPGTTVFFPQTAIGSRNDIVFRIRNNGNRDAVLTTLSITQPSNSYALAAVPPLPSSLPPGQQLNLTVQFTARTQGAQTATLQVNTDSFPMSGTGATPPPLPGVTYSGVSGTVQPLQQPSLGMALNQPYPIALRGQLRLQFESASFADDPALQFATGGRTVDFQIPAGTLDAIFPTGNNRIRFQTGTVAGTILVAPSFAVEAFPITENLPDPLRLTLPPSAPQLLTLQVAVAAPGTITFLVTGATTTRSLRSIEFTFQPTEAYRDSLSATSVTVNVEAQANTYFRSAASTGTGGLFLGTVPFLLANGGSTPLLPGEVLQSVTVTVVNSLGRSNSETLALR